VVVQSGKYGFIDYTGRVTIEPQFVWADDFWRGLGSVYVCGHYASIDSSGTIRPLRVAVPGQLQPQREGQKIGFVTEDGRFRINPSFDDAKPFSEGLAAVQIGEKWGFVDASGKQAIRPQFTAAYSFREGVATAEANSSSVLIDRSGNVLASGFSFLEGIVSHGRIPARKDDKSGYLDLRGRVAIPFVYDSVRSFSSGLAAVEKAGKWGYVDTGGRLIIPFEFDDAGLFGSGLAPVKIGTRTAFIDTSGRIAFDVAAEHAAGFIARDENSGWLIGGDSQLSRFWTADHKFGYVNTSGDVIWGPADGSPDHPPLFGWSDDLNAESCRGIPESMKAAIARLFPR
jgi:hypothetical protein